MELALPDLAKLGQSMAAKLTGSSQKHQMNLQMKCY